MKNFKLGFTLAEVLITLGIIGVVAAIVMPTVMSSYQYKTVGVKLSKFVSQTEGAARAYVAQNDVFGVKNAEDATGFAEESFVYSTGFNGSGESMLKDGTIITIDTTNNPGHTGDADNVGVAAFNIIFQPKVNGMPSSAHKSFTFTVTELGYVYPNSGDICLSNLAAEGYAASKKIFTDAGCLGTTTP